MSGDTLVFDMASESEGTPSVFVRKDWLSILDNQNGSYQGNQSVIDTSQLANSNKYINYREAYFTIPMVMTLTAPLSATASGVPLFKTNPMAGGIGLKNWYGSIIHSFTLDYNGTTIIQQTPYIGLWNTFKLMTSLSWDDVRMMGSQIGFYPDSSESVQKSGLQSTEYTSSAGVIGTTSNNQIAQGVSWVIPASNDVNNFATLSDMPTNLGLQQRMKSWNFDPQSVQGSQTNGDAIQKGCFFQGAVTGTASNTLTTASTIAGLTQLWKSYIFNKVDCTSAVSGSLQWAITAQVYLKHIHSFFERVPLLKGVFCKMTLNLNQSVVSFTTTGATSGSVMGVFSSCSVASPLGGVSPIMITSGNSVQTGSNTATDPVNTNDVVNLGAGSQLLNFNTTYIVSLAVGQRCLSSLQTSATGSSVANSPLGTSIILNAPAYSFSPVFEASYLAEPVKKIVYSDVYQYQVLNVASGGVFNNLITNGIANIKSVLVLPFFSAGTAGVAGSVTPTGNGGLIPFQSPFDSAGGGSTSPFCMFSQFNIQISGQNAIYNTERYAYEQWLNQTYGVNAVNAGMSDGLVSGLVSQQDFETNYNYYYVNCGRMLPVEEAVPKSVNIIGQSMSNFPVDLYIFVEYGVEIDVDVLTGARV
jgi:hypothetical protein